MVSFIFKILGWESIVDPNQTKANKTDKAKIKENFLPKLPEAEEGKEEKESQKERKYLPSWSFISIDGTIDKEEDTDFLIIDQNTLVYKTEKATSYLDERGEVVKKINPVFEEKIDKLNIKIYIEK